MKGQTSKKHKKRQAQKPWFSVYTVYSGGLDFSSFSDLKYWLRADGRPNRTEKALFAKIRKHVDETLEGLQM